MTLMPPLPEVDRLPIDDILNEPVERPSSSLPRRGPSAPPAPHRGRT
ncbi:hypothetical protein [Streptomyces sp. NEAU-H3]|nr:hypothetical protein [Streptomyces sp. NEAU-H3]NJA55676.1 hypothetical protein [Streptomyces sp. NEAU-H3]